MVKTDTAKKTVKKKQKTWGDDGFIGQISYGCYTYRLVFTPAENIKNIIELPADMGRVYGAISCDGQTIVIGSNTTEQLKRLTVWHEIMHMIILNNNIYDSGSQIKPEDENFTDVMASRIYEVTRRNPELMRWLMK